MKKITEFLLAFQPLYVIVTSFVGFVFVFVWLKWSYPFPGDPIGERFTGVILYPIWVFEHSLIFAFCTVFLLPLWRQFLILLRGRTQGKSQAYKLGVWAMLFFGVVFLFAYFLMWVLVSGSTLISVNETWPQGMNERLILLFFYPFTAIISIPLSVMLIYLDVTELNIGLLSGKMTKKELLNSAQILVEHRSKLQNGLLIMGAIVSMIPIVTATLRSILITLDIRNEELFPLTGVIAYGLAFTVLLIVFYVPTHLILTKAGENLRDKLFPITKSSNLSELVNRRKNVDEWLQINLNLMENLRSGIVTLAPLVTSFVASILGVKI